MKKHFFTLFISCFREINFNSRHLGILFAALLGAFTLSSFNNTLNAQCQTCCNGSKPKSLVLLYNGKSCSESVTCQAPDKWSCSGAGPGNAATVYITVSKNVDGTGGTYFAGNVALNTEFTANSASGGSSTFPSNTYFNVYSSQGGSLLQAVKIHTSCSTPLVAGDQLGSFKIQKIVLADNTACNAPTPPPPPPTCPTPTITINNSSSTNVGPVCKGDQVIFKTTDLGYSCFVYTWNFGPNATPSTATGIGPHTVTYSAVGNATVTLSTTNNCAGGVGSTICPPPPPPPMGSDCCDSNSGKPKILKLKYTGQSCATTNTTQGSDKYSCADIGNGPNGASSVYIKVAEKEDGTGKVYFTGTVALNAFFEPNAGNAGDNEFRSNTWFLIYSSQGGTLLQKVKIHTSCSAPLVPGESFGSLYLESATWSSGATCDINSGSGGSGSGGADCCDSNSGKPKSLTMQYNGESCSESNTSQSTDKYSCADVGGGPNGAASVYIIANEKADGSGITYFSGNVSLGGTFSATSPSTTLPTNTYFIIKASQSGPVLQNIKIHTSCSAPIVSGDQFGSLVLVSATWSSGVTCGPVTPPGPDCIDCQATVTTTVNVVDCNPCDVNLNISNIVCNGKGTATTTDDTYTFTVNVTGTNTSGQWVGSFDNPYLGVALFGPNPYNTPVVLGPFPAGQFTASNTFPPITVQNGLDINVSVSDAQNSGCSDSKTVASPGPCSCVDSDNDGICDVDDCKPNDPAYPTTPGTPCNDGNPNTNNDVVTADGCGCAGTPSGPDCVNDINISVVGNSIVVTGLGGAPVSSLQVFSSSWQTVFSCFANCGSSQSLTVPAGTYYVYAKYYTAGYQFICERQATLTVTGGVCENVDNGGTIGFGNNCSSTYVHCPANGPAPTIGNCVSPSGGSGNLEIVWLKSTTSCSAPTTTAAQIAAGLDPHWTMIPGATGLTYNPGTVTQATCYLRCARRNGCPVFIESNIISLTIDPNCANPGPDCSNINISTVPCSIVVSGLDGAPITSVQIFSSTWQPEYSCFGNCASPTGTYCVGAGTHYVKVKYYTANYQFICEVNQTVNVSMSFESNQAESFQFDVIKHEEHTELIWAHDGGYRIQSYILERSADGSRYETINGSASKGGNAMEVYELYDLEPLEGDNYYRLKMLNADGSFTYSEAKLVRFPVLDKFSLFPNPANGFVNVNLESIIGKEDISITIYNSFGIELQRFHLDEVYSKYYQMDIRELHEGYYIVWVKVPGKRPIANKLMVGKI